MFTAALCPEGEGEEGSWWGLLGSQVEWGGVHRGVLCHGQQHQVGLPGGAGLDPHPEVCAAVPAVTQFT